MLEFLKAFVAWLNEQNILPVEVTTSDRGIAREDKTYLMNLPEDADNVICVRQYNQRLSSLAGKEAGVRYIQIIVRNKSHAQALSKMETVYNFLKNRPDYIEDMSPDYWVIIDCKSGPIKLDEDEQGRYMYSLSLPITTIS